MGCVPPKPDARGIRRLLFCTILLALSLDPARVGAASCLEQARELAQAHDLSFGPPTSEETPGPEPSDTPAEVPTPPAKTKEGVDAPPPEAGLPTRTPSDRPAGTRPSDDIQPPLRPEYQEVLESILLAARAEAKSEREGACFEKLQEAKRHIQRSQERRPSE